MGDSPLVEGQQYVISPDVMKGDEEHPQLDGGELVKLINANIDNDGEVYVTGEAVEDDATIGCWVEAKYLWTLEQAEAYVESMQGNQNMVDPEPEAIREFSYVPHPDYPNLPTFETLPLGYALGVVQFIKDLGVKPVDPQAAMLLQYLQSRGFPTG